MLFREALVARVHPAFKTFADRQHRSPEIRMIPHFVRKEEPIGELQRHSAACSADGRPFVQTAAVVSERTVDACPTQPGFDRAFPCQSSQRGAELPSCHLLAREPDRIVLVIERRRSPAKIVFDVVKIHEGVFARRVELLGPQPRSSRRVVVTNAIIHGAQFAPRPGIVAVQANRMPVGSYRGPRRIEEEVIDIANKRETDGGQHAISRRAGVVYGVMNRRKQCPGEPGIFLGVDPFETLLQRFADRAMGRSL